MKSSIVKGLLAVLAITLSAQAHALVSSDLESLGSNAESVRRANKLESRAKIAIVQNRTVDRHWRLEGGVNYGAVAAGDSYLNTQNLSFDADLHISPKFSLGVRYAEAFNQLTPEGKAQFDAARSMKNAGQMDYRIPDIDYPKSSLIGVINWYMMYGKINFFDASVIQFDIYSLAGAGTMQLSSGSTPTYTAGAGIGFWLSQHITSRIEMRYQTYQDQVYTGSRNLNLFVANLGIGVLL
jgi:outer membrane immunogenic protein